MDASREKVPQKKFARQPNEDGTVNSYKCQDSKAVVTVNTGARTILAI